MPSPAASQSGEPWRQNLTPGSGAYFDPARHGDYGTSPQDGGGGYDGRPPAFQPTTGQSPSSNLGMRRSVSGGLRDLLNDDGPTSRRSSIQSTTSAGAGEEDHRPSISRILNDNGGNGNGNMVKTNSVSSLMSSSPINASPVIQSRYLDNSGFLTPAPTSRRASRSPYPSVNTSVSPAQQMSHLPPHDAQVGEYDQLPISHAGPSKRRPSGGQGNPRPMLPPDTIPRQEYYDSSRITPGAQSYPLPLRSPSVSVSPRSQQMAISGSTSRPTSANSSGHPFSFQPAPLSAELPNYAHRALADPPSRSPSIPRSRQVSATPRRSSSTSVPVRTPLRSPSPIRTPYQPRRLTQPSSLLRPILPDEITRLRSAAFTNNPLRRLRKKPAPSWSGPSPGGSGRSKALPSESDSSYFPSHQTADAGPSRASRDSSSSAQPAYTPGGSSMPSENEVARRGSRAPAKRKESSQDVAGNGHDEQRRRGNDGHYIGNSAVASHCESILRSTWGFVLMLR